MARLIHSLLAIVAGAAGVLGAPGTVLAQARQPAVSIAGAALLAAAPDPTAAARCSIGTPDGRRWTPDVESTRDAVRRADVIIRARVVGADSITSTGQARRPPAVLFETLETIRGDSVPTRLSVYGWLKDADDFNQGTVPYAAVRPEGQRGSCFAMTYRLGAEYLLLLTREDGSRNTFGASPGELTPYWAPLTPTNEQLRGADDPWLGWVRRTASPD